MTGATFLIDDNPVARARRFMAGMPYRIPAGDGTGYLAGEFPDGITTVEGAPVSATVRILYRPESGALGDGSIVAEVQSEPNGSWSVTGLNPDLRYDVVGRKEGFNDVIVAGVTPTSMVEITYSGAVIENETFTGAEGYIEIVGGIPPYSVAVETPFPVGLFPIVDGRKLIIDGTTDADEVTSFDVKVTSSNGAEKIIPLQLVVGFKAPTNFKAETVVVDDDFSVSLTWEATNSTQQVKVYRSATPFDMDDLPEPIATLSGTSTTYTDDDVIEDDHFYYMVTAVCEQYELRSNVIVEYVREGDPHWDNVVALLHFDEGMTDETGRIWTAHGDARIDANQGLYGGCLLLDGSGDYLTTSASADFSPQHNNGKLTIEFLLRPVSTSRLEYLLAARDSASLTGAWVIERSATGTIAFVAWNPSGAQIGYASSSLPAPPDEWSHVSVSIDGNQVSVFVNGIRGTVATFSEVPTGNTKVIQLGRSAHPSEGNRAFTGRMDELRITKGVARYTEDFVPPAEPFPDK